VKWQFNLPFDDVPAKSINHTDTTDNKQKKRSKRRKRDWQSLVRNVFFATFSKINQKCKIRVIRRGLHPAARKMEFLRIIRCRRLVGMLLAICIMQAAAQSPSQTRSQAQTPTPSQVQTQSQTRSVSKSQTVQPTQTSTRVRKGVDWLYLSSRTYPITPVCRPAGHTHPCSGPSTISRPTHRQGRQRRCRRCIVTFSFTSLPMVS